jgi:hypothetical protein
LAKKTRYNNRKIIINEQTLPIGKLLPGMIVTFNYSERGVLDPRPVLLFLHHNKKNNIIEGLNMNYINPSKIKRLFNQIDFKKGVTGMENLVYLKEEYFRIEISTPKAPSPLTSKRFYGDVIGSDNTWLESYRSYKTNKLSSLKVTTITQDLIHIPGGSPFD